MKRFLSIWLPDWPLDRLRRARLLPSGRQSCAAPAEPFILTQAGAKGLVVVAANTRAKSLGVSAGLSFTDARARVPGLLAEPHDPTADAEALRWLAEWLVRYTPLVAVDGIDGLMLETTGCDHLHGGEALMAERLHRKLVRDGITNQIGLASTPGAASALARGSGQAWRVLAEADTRSGLADLPVISLRLSSDAVTLLRRFGLTRIGQLYDIDRKALARRFASKAASDAVCLRLDQALGRRIEPLSPLRPAPAHQSRLPCPEPIATQAAVQEGLRRLSETLCRDLAEEGCGARQFTLHAFRADGTVSQANISVAQPVRDAKHIQRLFAERIDRIDPGFGIDLLLLEARRTGPMAETLSALSGDLAAQEMDIAAVSALADRISAKLGDGAVTIRAPAARHIPEEAETETVFEGGWPEIANTAPPVWGARPLRLFDPPEPAKVLAEVPEGPPAHFVWRRIARKVARADGPERIAPEWWTHAAPPPPAPSPDGTLQSWLAPKLDPRADADLIRQTQARLAKQDAPAVTGQLPRTRDYYRIEDSEGRRYWLYREGLYDDGRGGAPNWYVHGAYI